MGRIIGKININALADFVPKTAADREIVDMVSHIAKTPELQDGEADEIEENDDNLWLASGEAQLAWEQPEYKNMISRHFPDCRNASQFFLDIEKFMQTRVETPATIAVRLNDPKPSMRVDAAISWVRFAVQQQQAALRSEDEKVSMGAAQTLIELRHAQAYRALGDALKDKTVQEVTRVGIVNLLGDKERLPRDFERYVTGVLVDTSIEKPVSGAARAAIYSLVRLGTAATLNWVSKFIVLTTDAGLRQTAIDSLQRNYYEDGWKSNKALVSLVANNIFDSFINYNMETPLEHRLIAANVLQDLFKSDYFVIQFSDNSLARGNAQERIFDCQRLVGESHEDPAIRTGALEILLQLARVNMHGIEQLMYYLANILRDRRLPPELREMVVSTVVHNPTVYSDYRDGYGKKMDIQDVIEEALTDDPAAVVRTAVTRAIGLEAFEDIQFLKKEPSTGWYKKVQDKIDGVVELLDDRLDDDDWQVRLAAIGALGSLGAHAKPALDNLEKLGQKDPNEMVRQSALGVVERLRAMQN